MMLRHASLNSGIAAATDCLSPFSAQMVHSSTSSPLRPRPCAVLMTFTVAFQYSTLSFLAILGSTLTSLFLPEICFGLRRERTTVRVGVRRRVTRQNFPKKLEKRYFSAAL